MTIQFEKWVDPFVEPETDYQDSYQDKVNRYTAPVLIGPMGVIPVTESNAPSAVYNFWMMHTNFDIDAEAVKKIETISGVETLDLFTRYRARIGFGKVFDENKVMKRIKLAFKKEKISSTIEKLKESLNKEKKFWAILVFKDKKIKIFKEDTKELVQQKLDSEIQYEEIHKSW